MARKEALLLALCFSTFCVVSAEWPVSLFEDDTLFPHEHSVRKGLASVFPLLEYLDQDYQSLARAMKRTNDLETNRLLKDTVTEFKLAASTYVLPYLQCDISLKDAEEVRIRKFLFCTSTSSSSPKMTFMGGGTAAGKSSILPQMQKMGFASPNATHIDPDDIMMMLDDWKLFANSGPCAATLLHEKASSLAKSMLDEAFAKGVDILYDGTMASVMTSIQRIRTAASKGYTVYIAGVTRDTKTAAMDAVRRAKSINRWVQLSVLVSSHAKFSNYFPIFAAVMDNSTTPTTQNSNSSYGGVVLFDGNNSPPAIIWLNDKVLDETAYEKFLFKAHDRLRKILPQLPQDIADAYAQLEEACADDTATIQEVNQEMALKNQLTDVAGQLQRLSGTISWGGFWEMKDSQCIVKNPLTNDCECPDGYNAAKAGDMDGLTLVFCFKPMN